MIINSIFWTLSSLFGFQIVSQTKKISELQLIFPYLRHDSVVCSIQLIVILCFWLVRNSNLLTLLLLFCISLPLILKKLLFSYWIQLQFQKNILNFMDLLLIRSRSGIGLRTSLSLTGEKAPPFFKKLSEALVEGLDLSPFEIKPFKWFAPELSRILLNSSRAIEQLSSTRKVIKILVKFQIRRNQALYQARAQAVGISIMYALLIAWRASEGQLSTLKLEFQLSLAFFGIGLIWLCLLGRKIKWKS